MDQGTALLVSITVEAVVAAGVLGLSGWGRPLLGVAAAVTGTLITHPLLWLAYPEIEIWTSYWTAFAVVEAMVVLVETFAYRLILPTDWARAFALSFVANAASAGVGMAYYYSAGL
ncbi:MAG: hypothetical protein NTV97_01500 [Alphaproteobacteria bacterium]|nr:hypothetical protein [Alphaproteobacteria bacterium]